jgi:hypothetical protein
MEPPKRTYPIEGDDIMKITTIIFCVLGGLAAGFLGMTWLSDIAENKELIGAVEGLGADMSELNGLQNAAYLLIVSMIAGLGSIPLVLKGQARIASTVLALACVLPGFFAPKAYVFTFLLGIAATTAYFLARKQNKAVTAAPVPALAAQ